MESAPIPSQMILSGTLRRGKNLTSIVSKILVQVSAKSAGGEPWVLENPPACDEPTMVCGIDVCVFTSYLSVACVGLDHIHR